jgi:hypothetical protein
LPRNVPGRIKLIPWMWNLNLHPIMQGLDEELGSASEPLNSAEFPYNQFLNAVPDIIITERFKRRRYVNVTTGIYLCYQPPSIARTPNDLKKIRSLLRPICMHSHFMSKNCIAAQLLEV